MYTTEANRISMSSKPGGARAAKPPSPPAAATTEPLRAAEFFRTPVGVLYCGDARSVLDLLPEESVDSIIGSPPYFRVRDYQVAGQIGIEATVDEYLEALCGVYDHARRVLKPGGSCWVNIGDFYDKKNLALLPARFALKMRERGWIIRNDVIWRKTRCLPHPVKDRLISTHEHIYHFVQSEHYYYDLDGIRQPHAPSSISRVKSKITVSHKGRYGEDEGNRGRTIDHLNEDSAIHKNGRNPGDVFEACPSNQTDGHLATYPEELVEPRLKSTCPRGGTVMDFWMGSGTTAIVAERLGRRWIGIELNPTYCKIAQDRIRGRKIQPTLRVPNEKEEAVKELGRAILLEATYRAFAFHAVNVEIHCPALTARTMAKAIPVYNPDPDESYGKPNLAQRRREKWPRAIERAEAKYPDEEWSVDCCRLGYAIGAVWG